MKMWHRVRRILHLLGIGQERLVERTFGAHEKNELVGLVGFLRNRWRLWVRTLQRAAGSGSSRVKLEDRIKDHPG